MFFYAKRDIQGGSNHSSSWNPEFFFHFRTIFHRCTNFIFLCFDFWLYLVTIFLKKNYFVFQKIPSQNKFFHPIVIFFQTFYPMAIFFSTFHPIEISFSDFLSYGNSFFTFHPMAAKNRSTEIWNWYTDENLSLIKKR